MLRDLPPELFHDEKEAIREKARRSTIHAFAHMSDEWVANEVRMLMRDDLYHEAICCAARDRIMMLSLRVEQLERSQSDASGGADGG